MVLAQLKVCEQCISEKKLNFFCCLAADTNGVNDKSENDNPVTQMTVDTMPTSMPCVVAKSEPKDNYCPPEPLESSVTWVKMKDIALTSADKQLLTNGEKVSDKHINAAQRILKITFPKINGLRLILLQDKPHKESTKNALQIFHIERNH